MGTEPTGESNRCQSGVYLIDAAEREQVLRHGAFPAEFAIAVLDGTDAATRSGFFQAIACALDFPDYFGRNWDAVYDCLTDFNWLPAAGYVLVLDGFDQFATNEAKQWNIALKVLRDACAWCFLLLSVLASSAETPARRLRACEVQRAANPR